MTQISGAGNPKRQLSNCQAGPTASSTPLLLTPRCRGVDTLCVAGPLATSLRGLWVSGLLPPDSGGPYQSAATLEPSVRRRGRLGPRAGVLKRKRPNCHSCPKGTHLPAWVLHQGEGPPKTPVHGGEGTPGVDAPLHLTQSLGHARVEARGVVGRIGGIKPFHPFKYEVYLLPKALDKNVTKLHVLHSVQSSPSFPGNKHFLEVKVESPSACKNEVYLLSKALDENVTKFPHSPLGTELTDGELVPS